MRITLIIIAAIFVNACSTPSHGPKKKEQKGDESPLLVVPTPDIRSFQKELAGTWKIISMRRQQKADLEMLSDVTLKFDEKDTKFSGKAPCNSIFGTIQLNGYSIRFQNIGSTKMACDKLEQETAFLDLLQTRISAFTVDGDKLYLRDGISNIVFEGEREKVIIN